MTTRLPWYNIEEGQYLIHKPGYIQIKEDCPEHIRLTIEQKIEENSIRTTPPEDVPLY